MKKRNFAAVVLTGVIMVILAACGQTAEGNAGSRNTGSAISSSESNRESELERNTENLVEVSTQNQTSESIQTKEPVVYMTQDISPEGLQAVYEALGYPVSGENVAVKISTGETGSSGTGCWEWYWILLFPFF